MQMSVRLIKLTLRQPNKLIFWNLKEELHTTTMSQHIPFKKRLQQVRGCVSCIYSPIAASHWHADDLFMQPLHVFVGHFKIQLSPNNKLGLFCHPDAAKRRGRLSAFGVLIDFHTSLVIRSCVMFLTLTEFLPENLP